MSLKSFRLQSLDVLVVCIGLVFASISSASAGFIRDAEVEALLQDYTSPLLKESGLVIDNVEIAIIADERINAYVSGGQNIFVFSGLITQAEHPNMVIGVMAHEIGHITGGHLARGLAARDKAGTPIIVGAILGLGSLLAGAPQVGMALIAGGQQVGLASYLTYSRAQEASADQVALQLLQETKQSPQGIMNLMDHLAGQEILSEQRQDPYQRTHPMSRDRVNAYRSHAETSPYFNGKDNPDMQWRHDMAKAKLDGFIKHPQSVLRKYSDASEPALYARAIAYHRLARTDEAISVLNELISKHPENPWFQELKGQIYYETGEADKAIAPYEKSLKLKPNQPLLMIGLASSLLASDQNFGGQARTLRAIEILREATRLEKTNLIAFSQLSKAYGHMNNVGMAEWALAENLALRGDPSAIRHANRAIDLLEPGQSERLRAQDIAASDFGKKQ
mgnify:CR=1 FL=1